MKKSADPTDEDIRNMMTKVGAKTEEEFQDNLLKNWRTVRCKICGKKLDLLKACYDDGDPVHPDCL